MTVRVASANELAAFFRQRQAAEDGDRWYGGSTYEGEVDQWIQWPEWLNARCDDRYSALDAGGCCRDSGNAVIRLVLHAAGAGQDILAAFVRGDRGCAATAADLAPLVNAVPHFVAAIRTVLAGTVLAGSPLSRTEPSGTEPSVTADITTGRALAVQLGCALDRLSLFTGRLATGRRCPWRCGRHGHPDTAADLAPLRGQIDECSGAIWDVLHPRPRRAVSVST
ncbi:MAG TPA: hypothetical protein VK817_02235 [Trebonia sp.]|jgi:hypothetical protein|nr:hypothetical protein [Trebonia sp.]